MIEGISQVAVVGAGTMGAGIAGVFARANCAVRLVDLSTDLLQQGLARLRSAQETLIQAGVLTAQQGAAALERIQPLVDLGAGCAGAQLAVESVNEDLALKQALFRRLDAACPAGAVLASNSSGLSISAMARATRRPECVAGLHFWNPPHIVPLVEVTRGDSTSDATAELLLRVCRQLGKRPILVRHDVPGFVGNRLQCAVVREALHLLAEGIASAEDIDTAMTAGPGLRYGLLGPLRTADLGGLDVFYALCSYLFPDLSAAPQPPELLARLVREGKLGAKALSGFYAYDEGRSRELIARRDRVLLGFLKVLHEEGGDSHDG